MQADTEDAPQSPGRYVARTPCACIHFLADNQGKYMKGAAQLLPASKS